MDALEEGFDLFNGCPNDWDHVEESKNAQQANVDETHVVLDLQLGDPLTEAHKND